MQIVISATAKPELYALANRHTNVCAPRCCPACGRENGLKAHGYYQRHTTDAVGKPILFHVRRFKCRVCGTTVSCLPDFAQPYRLVSSETIHRAFDGDEKGRDVARNGLLVRRYWKLFTRFCVRLFRLLDARASVPRDEPLETAVWRHISSAPNSLATATQRLVSGFHITCFRQYECHQPRRPCESVRA